MRAPSRPRVPAPAPALALAALAALLAAAPSAGAQPAAGAGGPLVMDAPSAKGLAEAGGVLVDIRTPRERRASGTPGGAVEVPLQDDGLSLRPSFAADVLAATGGDPARPVALIDADGRRAGHAGRLLAARGFAQVFTVGEGLFGSNLGPGWVARGLPMAPCREC